LLASGYIAGASVAGILVAIFAFLPALERIQGDWGAWAKTSNPFFAGDYADWLGLLPFFVISILLYFVGRELLMKGKRSKT